MSNRYNWRSVPENRYNVFDGNDLLIYSCMRYNCEVSDVVSFFTKEGNHSGSLNYEERKLTEFVKYNQEGLRLVFEYDNHCQIKIFTVSICLNEIYQRRVNLDECFMKQSHQEIRANQEGGLTVFSDEINPDLSELTDYVGELKGCFSTKNLIKIDDCGIQILDESVQGWLHITSWPENYFYLEAEVNENNKVIGPVYRTPFIPFRETPSDEEYQVIVDGQLRYSRYHHPVTGQVISRQEFLGFISSIQQILAGYFPAELVSLLGYISRRETLY